MNITEEKWQKVVERGPVVPPLFELAFGPTSFYELDENGELNYDKPIGKTPHLYYDKSYADWYYYTFTAFVPVENEIGTYTYQRADEDEGSFEFDEYHSVDISDTSHWKTEKDFLESWNREEMAK